MPTQPGRGPPGSRRDRRLVVRAPGE